jgi:putative transposase
MRHRLFVRLVWTARDRAALIDLPRAQFLTRYLHAVVRQERAELWAMGIVSTHVHLLLRLHPLTSIPKLMQRMKGGSSAVARKEGIGNPIQALFWSKGYNAESVSGRAIENVRDYVNSQARRHPDEAITGWCPPMGGAYAMLLPSPPAADMSKSAS